MGVVGPWYLYEYQLPVYDHFYTVRNPFFEATRRFGKTTTKLVQIQERSRRQPGRITLWNEPWKEQARNIVIPEMEHVQESCPPKLRARFYRTDSFFEFPSTGSRLYLFGVNEDKGEGARGRAAHEIVNDELGSWVDASYIRNEVMRPMLLTTRGEMTDMGTPPEDLGHLFYEIKAQAIAEGRYIGRDIDAVTSISDEEKASFIKSMGGRMSTAVRRELYLEPVSNPEALVIPEYSEDVHDLPDDHARPEYYDTYTGIDLGLNDHTAVLFAYVDFRTRTLVIEDEYVANGKNTKEIVEACKAKEKDAWGDLPVFARWSDNELQQLYDMRTLHGYLVSPTRKDDKLAVINELRLAFGDGRVKIKKRCKNLRYQLKVGLWNDRRTDFKRGEKTGHLDAVAALIYLFRNISWTHNPYPTLAGLSVYTHFIPSQPASDPSVSALEDAFGRGWT